MKTEWKFSDLEYVRPDYKRIKSDYIKKTEGIKNAECAERVFEVMREVEEQTKAVYTMASILSIRHTLDTADEFYEKENELLNQSMPELMPYTMAYNEALDSSPFRKDIEIKYGEKYFTDIDLAKKSFSEKNIPLMQREAVLCDEYQKIMASCKIDFKGETYNLYGIQKFFENTDRDIRREAYKAYSDFYHSNEQRLEEIWSELIDIRNEMGRNLGFENFIPLGYMNQGRTDYGEKEVAAFREQVREVIVPICSKLYEYQAKRLGIEETMAYDEDMIFPEGNAVPLGDEEFMVEAAKKMYNDLSPETGEFINFMIDHDLMDLKNKPGKASTGYCTFLPEYKAPFVFSCFNCTKFDMEVMTHELGHAFAFYMSMRNQPILNYCGSTTDIAEIHSMSMEQFGYPYAELFFGDNADKYRFAHLQDAITFVPFGVAVDEFQHICYANPGLTPKERTLEWKKLEEKYMPWRKYDADDFFDRGGYWYHKLHIYLYPFYYINYTLTTMGAMEFKKKRAEDKESAWTDYLNLCKVGSSLKYIDTLRYAHLSVPFEDGAVERIMSYARDIILDEVKAIS